MNIAHIDFIKKYEKYFFKIDEIDLVILRGHLLIEETLYQIISEFVFHPTIIKKAKLTFSQKTQLARSMSLDESQNSMWNLILAINALRNKISHQLPSQESTIKLDKIKLLYNYETKNAAHEYLWEQHGNTKGMQYAISLCIGFLQTFHEEAKKFKNIINSLDKSYNPHRHPN